MRSSTTVAVLRTSTPWACACATLLRPRLRSFCTQTRTERLVRTCATRPTLNASARSPATTWTSGTQASCTARLRHTRTRGTTSLIASLVHRQSALCRISRPTPIAANSAPIHSLRLRRLLCQGAQTRHRCHRALRHRRLGRLRLQTRWRSPRPPHPFSGPTTKSLAAEASSSGRTPPETRCARCAAVATSQRGLHVPTLAPTRAPTSSRTTTRRRRPTSQARRCATASSSTTMHRSHAPTKWTPRAT